MDGRHGGQALQAARSRGKLSQLELANLAGTTQRHLSFIESGRSAPGRDLVARLAESLELPLRERNTLLSAFGYAPIYSECDLQDPPLRPVLTALQHILDGHLPFPAIIVNLRGELVAANSALQLLTDGIAPELLIPPSNMYRLALHPRGAGIRIRNLAQWGWHLTERLRLDSLNSSDPVLRELRTELLGYLPAKAARRRSDGLGFAVPLHLGSQYGELRLITTITTFATATDVTLAELRLEAFLPADDATATILTKLHKPEPPKGDGHHHVDRRSAG